MSSGFSSSLRPIYDFSESQPVLILFLLDVVPVFIALIAGTLTLTVQHILDATPQMHRHRIVAQISLVLSILNLVLAAPIVVREVHEARRDEAVVVEDLALMPKRWHKLEAVPGRSISPRSSPDARTKSQDPSTVAVAPPEGPPSPSGSMSSGYSYDPPPQTLSQHLPDAEKSYAWLLNNPQLLSLPQEATPPRLHSLEEPPLPLPSPNPSSSGSSRSSEISHSPQYLGSLTVTPHVPGVPLAFINFPHPSSLNNPMPEGLAPSPPPPTEMPSGFFNKVNKDLMKKIGIVAGVALVGGTIIAGSIVGSKIKHHKHRDFQDD